MEVLHRHPRPIAREESTSVSGDLDDFIFRDEEWYESER